MSRLRNLLLSSSLLLSTLTATACSPATSRPADTGAAHAAVVTPSQRPADPAPDRAALRTALLARREQTVARFLAYREARVYPINTYGEGLQHVWIDELGNLCAAATLISGDWGRDLTAAAGAADNFIRLADVTRGALHDWMLTSGLTRHELVAIQEPMMYEGDLGRAQEITRLYAIYTSVERQLDALWDDSLDDAVDELMAHPALARRFLDGALAGSFSTAPIRA